MTKNQLLETGHAFLAAAQGRPWQYFSGEKWIDAIDEEIWKDVERYPARPKPELKTRPWSKPEDVPTLCWLRFRHSQSIHMLVTTVWVAGISCRDNGKNPVEFSFGFMPEKWALAEYSTDRKTWHKCEVSE